MVLSGSAPLVGNIELSPNGTNWNTLVVDQFGVPRAIVERVNEVGSDEPASYEFDRIARGHASPDCRMSDRVRMGLPR
jgi:hypothetical protein